MITTESVPPELKSDKEVTPFIVRSVELHTVNPVVSYYCKLYVLEHILSNKLHLQSKEVETFTVALLDDTEATKTAHDDESVQKVLASKQLSFNLVFVFAFKLYNSCLEELSTPGYNKKQLVGKFRAALNFWLLLKIFSGDDETEIDFAATTAGKCNSASEFALFTKDKVKTLKYQLSRVIKDEVPVKNDEQELDDELARLERGQDPSVPPAGPDADVPTDDVPKDAQVPEDAAGAEDAPFSLPGAPKFDPSSDEDSHNDTGDLKLPGAPRFLPDDDITHINKKSSIQVFKPEPKSERSFTKPVEHQHPPVQNKPPPVQNHAPVTKQDISAILDTTEHISKIQKHAKFAISALNYEDLATAEAELTKGLEMLRLMREQTKS